MTKHCPRCDTEKALYDFPMRQDGKPKTYCHPCYREYQRAYRDANAGRLAQWRAGRREKRNAIWRSFYQRYRIKRNRQTSEYAALHAQEIQQKRAPYQRAWKKANRPWQMRRALKRSADHESIHPATLYSRDGGRCGICGLMARLDRWDLDHVIPVTRGGSHTYANTRVSHPVCNRWKHNRLDSELPPIPLRVLAAAQHEADLVAIAA